MSTLTSNQRKALRRLSRGQSINRGMWHDPIISLCIDTSHYVPPPDIDGMPYPQSMIAWCDWEYGAGMANRPRLNDYGRQLLEELNQ